MFFHAACTKYYIVDDLQNERIILRETSNHYNTATSSDRALGLSSFRKYTTCLLQFALMLRPVFMKERVPHIKPIGRNPFVGIYYRITLGIINTPRSSFYLILCILRKRILYWEDLMWGHASNKILTSSSCTS